MSSEANRAFRNFLSLSLSLYLSRSCGGVAVGCLVFAATVASPVSHNSLSNSPSGASNADRKNFQKSIQARGFPIQQG